MRIGRGLLRMKPMRCEPKIYISKPNPPTATSNTGNSEEWPRERAVRRALATASADLLPTNPIDESAA